MRKHSILLIMIVLVILLTGCKDESIGTEKTRKMGPNTTYEDVYVKIVEEYYKEPEYSYAYNGHIWYNYMESDAEYIIIVKYKNDLYRIDDKYTWEKYSNQVGDYVKAKLAITVLSGKEIYTINEIY